MLEMAGYANGDDSALFWRADQRIADCWGFALERSMNGESEVLPNFVGFKPTDRGARPSTEWPIQRFRWHDHLVGQGDVASYRVIPMIQASDRLEPDYDSASPWTEPIAVTAGRGISAYFNRGIIATQFVARLLGEEHQAKRLSDAIDTPGDPIRNTLGGDLRAKLLHLLADAAADRSIHVYAALFELHDAELEAALLKLGKRAHVILANGAAKKDKKTGRLKDQNAEARRRLRGKVDLVNRMLKRGRLGHNKFLVWCKGATPTRVWTGSTNWSRTGLCTQANNGLLISSPKLAEVFKEQWDRLKRARNGFPQTLLEDNEVPASVNVGPNKVTVWFTPTPGRADVAHARSFLEAAKDGILFLMFNPGTRGSLLEAVQEIDAQSGPEEAKDLYIRGVVNQDPGVASGHPVFAYDAKGKVPMDTSVVLPAAIETPFASWRKELRKLPSAWAMVHSKCIVIDPLGEHPVVMTGSHNLGLKASRDNDDNLVIIEGDRDLALAYAVNIMSIYETYRWRQNQVRDRQNPWSDLREDDRWQDHHFSGERAAELRFWLGTA